MMVCDTDHCLLSLRRLSIRACVARPLTPGHNELLSRRSSHRLHFTASRKQKYWRSMGIGNNLDLGHCESGVWNTGWCCMALPTLYYFTISLSTWISGSLNFRRATRRQRTLQVLSFIVFSFYHYISICGSWPFEVMRRRRRSDTCKSVNSSAPKKELDRSGPGQPYFNH
jgi:hypothetical protein